MTTAEIVSNAIAALALIVSIVALVKSSSASTAANDIAKENLKLTHAQVEIDLRTQVTESRRNVEDFFERHGDFLAANPDTLDEQDKDRRKRLSIAGNSAVEGYLSALDGACQKYIDGKIDKVRFQKDYQREIRQAIEDEAHRDFFHVGHGFHALMRVYEEWENPEKA